MEPKASQSEHELTQPTLRQEVDVLLSTDALAAETARIHDALTTHPDFLVLADITAYKEDLEAQGRVADGYEAENAAFNQADVLGAALESHPTYARYAHMLAELKALERDPPKRLIDADSTEAKALFGVVARQVALSPDRAAPFIDYASNTPDVWQHIPDTAIQEFLENRFYMNTEGMGLEGSVLSIDSHDEPFEVPASLFVSASRFSSWKGRGDDAMKDWNSVYGNEPASSLGVMKHYAALPTELPPISEAKIYVQPDGRYFADNAGGDSHRLGAAILRGDAAIKAHTVQFIQLERNVLPEDFK